MVFIHNFILDLRTKNIKKLKISDYKIIYKFLLKRINYLIIRNRRINYKLNSQFIEKIYFYEPNILKLNCHISYGFIYNKYLSLYLNCSYISKNQLIFL